MLLRFIIWLIIIFIVVKILSVGIRYLRRLFHTNLHIKNFTNIRTANKNNTIEDIPYEDVSDKE